MKKTINRNLKVKRNVGYIKKIIFIGIIISIIWTVINRYSYIISNRFMSEPVNEKNKVINIEELSINEDYLGKGQEVVEGKDGYDTIFTTHTGKIYKEYKQVGNASWKNKSYWGGTFEENGCGLAAISTLLSGYKLEYTPEDLRKKYIKFEGEHLEGDQMAFELSNIYGIDNSDFLYSSVYFKEDYIINHLEEDKPILICVWNNPNDKWTTSSHYMLLLATDGKEKVYVSNPNGLYGKVKMSGWYKASDILPYIAKAMFINE